MTYEPKYLKRWTMPDNYFGATWPEYYSSGFGRSRNSDVLEESNFECALRALGGESETVIVVQESHWAVGWVEWIAIHESDDKALQIADSLRERYEDYSVLDEDHFGELEWNRTADYWDSLSPRDKVKTALDVRKRYHWLDGSNCPCWPYGRLSLDEVANRDDRISQALYDLLRE